MRKLALSFLFLVALAAVYLFRDSILVSYAASRVCYEPGPAKCHPALRPLQDTTLDGRHAFGGEAWVLLGIPAAWRVWIYWVGDDYLAPVGRHDFNPFRDGDTTRVHGMLRADLVRRGPAYHIEAKLDSLPGRIWLEMERKQ